MHSYQSIRNYMKKWASLSYQDGLDQFYELTGDEHWRESSYKYLHVLGLNDKRMDGYSFNGIRKNNIYTRISFTSIFHNCISSSFFSPATYYSGLVKACLEQRVSRKTGIAILCRGLLSFPSFIREYDLQIKLEDAIEKRGVKVGSSSNPDLDINQHTDIIVVANDCANRIWSYQSTDRGLLFAKKKLRGDRGEIDSGYHVLCPIDIYGDAVDYYGWRLYSDAAVSKAVDLILSDIEPETYQAFLSSMDSKMKVIYRFVKL